MIRSVWDSFTRVWTADHGLSLFLGILVVMVFVVAPVATPDPLGRLLVNAIFTALLLTGLAAASQRRIQYLLLPIVIVTLVLRWVSWFAPYDLLLELNVISRLLSYSMFCGVLMARVFGSGPVTVHRIQGAIAGYLLLGLAWATIYELMALRLPGAFAGLNVAPNAHRWIYFSLVTLTTVGYGDMVPVHPLVRSFANLEALVGQLYPAILLARLVSLQTQTK